MRLFSTEAVSKYHPDKYADQISDAILTECLKQDRQSHCGIETMVKGNTVVLGGEITSKADINYNKLSLARRAEKETNLKVQLLLRKDMKFLDDIQLQMSTAREFMFACRVKNANDQSFATLNRLEKQINDQGFDCRRATKDDIKRILSRYFGHMTEDAIDDVDGERMIKKWIIPD